MGVALKNIIKAAFTTSRNQIYRAPITELLIITDNFNSPNLFVLSKFFLQLFFYNYYNYLL